MGDAVVSQGADQIRSGHLLWCPRVVPALGRPPDPLAVHADACTSAVDQCAQARVGLAGQLDLGVQRDVDPALRVVRRREAAHLCDGDALKGRKIARCQALPGRPGHQA